MAERKPILLASEETEGGGGPDSPNAAAPVTKEKKTLSIAAQLAAKKKVAEEKLGEQCKDGRAPGEPYLVATRRAKQCIKTFAKEKMRLYPFGMDTLEEIKKGTPYDKNLLAKYSPKYAEILYRILDSPGSSLVYSQFLDMEGIGIFNIVMQCNDFSPVEIIETSTGEYKFSPTTLLSLKKGPGANRYISFTGSEERNIRNLALKLFNARYSEDDSGGRFIDLPPQMSAELVKNGFKGNLHGELCRVFCITSAGAEGLSLRNVRSVHIMEPYWNPVRTDQVKGRAVRICSHVDLEWSAIPEENERTVEVFTYCSVFADDTLQNPGGSSEYPPIPVDLIMSDGGEDNFRVIESHPEGGVQNIFTTDEYMHSISERKRVLMSTLQNIMKSSAVDCILNEYENEDDRIACIQLPGNTSQYAYHPILTKDIIETSSAYRKSGLPQATVGLPKVGDALPKAKAPETFVEIEEAERGSGSDDSYDMVSEKEKPISINKPTAVPKPKVGVVKARLFTYKTKQYMAVPELKSGMTVPLLFKLYEPGDKMQRIPIGTMMASSTGGLTKDIVLFDY